MSQQRIVRNTLLAIVGVAGAGAVRFAFTIATGRAFGSAILGDIAVIIAVATIATIPSAGVGAAGNRFLAIASGEDDAEMRRSTLGAAWRGATLTIAVAVIGSWVYLTVQQSTSLDTVSIVLGLAFVATYGFYLASKGVLFGDGRAGNYAVGEIIGVAAFAVSLVIVLSASLSPGWVLLSQVAWTMGVVIVAIAIGVGPTSLKGRAPDGLWAFATTATVGSLVSLGVIQATVLVMAAFHGSEQAGLLAAAVAVTAPLYLLPRGLSLALTPSMSFQVGAGTRERANLDASYTTTLLVLFGGVAAATIVALTGIVLSAYGSEFAEADTFLAVFAIASFVAITGIPVVNRFASEGERALRITVVASAIGAVAAGAIWFTIGQTDPTWIAIGFLVASFTKVAIPFALSRSVTGEAILPGVGVSVLIIIGIAGAFLPSPWQFIDVLLLILASLLILFVATVRYRAQVAGMSVSDRPFRIGVITNVYPLPDYPYYGVFVRDRVVALEELGVKVIVTAPRRKTGRIKYLLLTFDALAHLLTRPIPDVFDVHPTQPTGILGQFVSAIAQRPNVLYAHGSDVATVPHSRGYRNLVARAVHSAAEIHTNSPYMQKLVEELWHPSVPVVVIPPGIRVPGKETAFSDRDIDILYVGNMNEAKGLDVLLEATSQLDPHLRQNVVFVGGGSESESIMDHADRLNLPVTFTGAVDPAEVDAYMARAKLFALASRAEGLGQVAIEALANGTPIVVSDVGGLESIPTPQCGTVVPVDDPEALAEALTTWLTRPVDEWLEASQAARVRSEKYAIGPLAMEASTRFKSIASQYARQSEKPMVSGSSDTSR